MFGFSKIKRKFAVGGAAPIVTGISPAEGPPGTIVKIRGENLGISAKDLKGVIICGQNCTFTAEWQHTGLIHARTSMGIGLGDIIIYTKTGDRGSSLVKFRGYMPRVGLLTEAAVWVDESRLFEDKPSSTFSNFRMHSPDLTTYTDPLGLAPTDSDASLSQDQIEEWYKGSSSNPLSENFDPCRFLLERHLDTSFDALKSGYHYLQSQDTRTTINPTSSLRANLDTVLNSLTTLNEVQKFLKKHESESTGGDICEDMQGILQSCSFASISLFKDILSRKDEADAKRNVLNVLQRFRFLFNLPRSIEKNIQQGEYEILISDYDRAKALFQNTEVKSFQKALEEVDQKISAFSNNLKKQLFDFPTPLEEQKKIIRYLNDLDYPGDAGWECITEQSLWIRTKLVNCQVIHKSGDNFEKLHTSSKYPLDCSSRFQKYPLNSILQELFMVEDLCNVISEHLPVLWNLGQTYLSNQLGEQKNPLEMSRNSTEEFLDLIKEVVSVFCDITHGALLLEVGDNSKDEGIIQWLPEAVKLVQSTLDKLDNLVTDKVIMPLKTLTSDSVVNCVNKVLSASVQQIQRLGNEEKWELIPSSRSYYTSKLPYKFEKIFLDSLKFIRDFFRQPAKRYSKDCTKYDTSLSPPDIVPSLKKMIEEFLNTLEGTVFNVRKDGTEECTVDNNFDRVVMQHDRKVLVLLSNCHHVKDSIVPRMMSQCIRFGYGDLKNFHKEINDMIEELGERVFMAYIEIKRGPIIDSVEVGINSGEYRWDGLQENNTVRKYVQDILMQLVIIHDEVSSVSNIFTNRIFTTLVELISDELLRIFECIGSFSSEGGFQAALELNVLMSVLGDYINKKAKSNFTKSLGILPCLSEKEEKEMKEIIEKFRLSICYQISAFNTEETNTVTLVNNSVIIASSGKQGNLQMDRYF